MKLIKHFMYTTKTTRWMLMVLLGILFTAAVVTYSTGTSKTAEDELRSKISGIYAVLNEIVPAVATEENLPEEFQLLLTEEQLLNREYSMRIMDNEKHLTSVRLELIENERQLIDLQQQSDIPYSTDFLTTETQLNLDFAKYTTLSEQDVPFDLEKDDRISLLQRSLGWLLTLSLLIVALFHSDLLLSMRKLKGLGQNLPVDKTKVFNEILLRAGVRAGGIGVISLFSVTAFLLYPLGWQSLTYPIAILFQSRFMAVPLWLYLLFVLMGMILSIVLLTALQALLNIFLKNRYITMMVGSLWVVLSYLVNESQPLLLMVGNIMRFDQVLLGKADPLTLWLWLGVTILGTLLLIALFVLGVNRRREDIKGIIL